MTYVYATGCTEVGQSCNEGGVSGTCQAQNYACQCDNSTTAYLVVGQCADGVGTACECPNNEPSN